MTENNLPPARRSSPGNRIERAIETTIFNSRWLLAPFYFGLVISLLMLLLKFLRILFDFVIHAWGASESDIILGVLSLIDVTLTANLVVIVVFSGYENFVSRIDPSGHPDWPEWMTHIDFSGLKQKVLASIVAISAVQVLKAFMNLDVHVNTEQLAWLVGIHVGVVEEGHFKTVDDVVTLVDINGVQRFDKKGKPICHQLKPGEDARKVAYNLTRDNIPNRSGDFNRKIIYPNVGKF